MSNNTPGLKIAYILKMFPRLSETFVLNEILELERCGCEVVIFSLKKPNEGRFHPRVSQLKARVFYLEDLDPKKWQSWIAPEWPVLSAYQHRMWNLINDALQNGDIDHIEQIWWSAWIAAQASKLGIERLHAHFASLPSTIAHFVHLITDIPYSFTAHAKDIFVYSLDEHLLREKLNTAAFVVTVTEFNKRYLTERSPEIDPQRIRVIHNGIDLDQFSYVNADGRKPGLILSVGRLVAKKGFADLLSACANLKQRKVAFKCVIVGEGPDALALAEQRSSLNLEAEVEFVGAKNIDGVLALMHTASVFCLPCAIGEDNNMDALPTVLLEALAAGLPSISTTVSGIPEIIENEREGALVAPNDPIALSEQLSRFLTTPDLTSRFSKAGREKAERKFDLHKNVATLLQEHIAHTRTIKNRGSAAQKAGVK